MGFGGAPAWRIAATVCVIAVAFAVHPFAGSQSEGPVRSVWEGVFSQPQAERGKAIFVQSCGTCHSSGDQAPALYGLDFLMNYDGKTMAVLFDRVAKTMPQDNPGRLTPQETADVVAYVLSLSFPSGQTELAQALEPLKQIRIDAAKPK
jgi:quinoprotein glucose dehydrogenase